MSKSAFTFEERAAVVLMTIGLRRETSWQLAVLMVTWAKCLTFGLLAAALAVAIVMGVAWSTAPINQAFPQADIREVPYGL